ncbi:MAG: DUF1643 domain-containing protein [Clostridia bacterium]|nr:DUF1643 domain-containing protein [Clostridia bacterium]
MAHIPAVDTRALGDLSFERELAAALEPNPDYDVRKWLFVPNEYTEYRYILGTRGKEPLICVGINPSTAAPDHLDPTLKSVERIALSNGFDSFIMFNVYAQRATSPDDMDMRLHEQLHRENMRAFEYALGLSDRPSVWAAWGSIIEKRDYLMPCAADMVRLSQRFGAKWLHCGPLSKSGHPHHPLYLKKDAPLEPFDAEGYVFGHSGIMMR